MRRPSPALVVALIALFVALGGPAGAAGLIRGSQIKKNTITSRQIKNHSLSTTDLSRRAVRQLRITPNGSVTQAKLANGAVTSAKIAGAAITGAKIATNSIGPLQVADHSLTATDIARFSGTFSATVQIPQPGGKTPGCWEQERDFPVDISNDYVYVMPGSNWPRAQVGFTVVGSTNPQGFVISGCLRSGSTLPPTPVNFRYIVFHGP
jgi:hypothetical protein